MASNVIQPVIDLTPSAEGSGLPDDLARAVSFGGITEFQGSNTTINLANTAGFWKVQAGVNIRGNTAAAPSIGFQITDGTTTKVIEAVEKSTTSSISEFLLLYHELTVFLRAGDTLQCTALTTGAQVYGSYHQIADVNGNLVNPSGFTPQ